MPSISLEQHVAPLLLPLVGNGGAPDMATAKAQARQRLQAALLAPSMARRKSSLTQTPPSKTISEKATLASGVLNRYRIEYKNDWDMPPSVLNSQRLIQNAMERGEPIELILPGFPFKSSNRSKKVLGPLPDEAERVSLQHLNGLCESIKDITDHECRLTIISDGISYNDLLSVPDTEVWKYGQALRTMAQKYECNNLRFSRIYELLGSRYAHLSHQLTQEEYLSQVSEFRNGLEGYTPENYNATEDIKNDPDVAQTYCGYKKFLETERDVHSGRSRKDKENADIAKRMLRRGKAFALAIKESFPHAVRLSIHPSADQTKISIALLPQENEIVMTPWHGAAVRKVDGSITMMHASNVSAMSHELVYEDGRPTHFRERSDLFTWNAKDLSFEYLYPTGIVVRPRSHEAEKYALCTVDMQKVRRLAEHCSPVVLRGFSNTKDRRAFTAKAHDLGEVLPWKSGVIQEVKDEGNADPESNSVVSNEAMPMHYDGMFKLVTVRDEATGQEKQVSDVPRFQYFVSQSVAGPGSGYTLFSSSARFAKYLPQSYNIKKLSKIRWSTHSHGYFQHDLSGLPLIVPHPTTEIPCVRWLQPWPRWKTAYNSHDITIDNGSQNLISLVDSVLFDRRVCLYFSWEEGDVLVSDNVSMLHTRTAFNAKSSRELWRIHCN